MYYRYYLHEKASEWKCLPLLYLLVCDSCALLFACIWLTLPRASDYRPMVPLLRMADLRCCFVPLPCIVSRSEVT